MVYFLAIALSMVLWWVNPADVAAAGNTYHVAKTGSDSNACSSSAPCLTIAKGISKLSAGDTLLIHAGTYFEGELIVSPSGSSWSNPITIAAYPGNCGSTTCNSVTIERIDVNSFTILDGIIVDGRDYWQAAVQAGSGPNRFQNMEVKNGQYHGFLGGGDGTQWINNNIHHNGVNTCFGDGLCHGIYWGGDNILIDGNTIHDHPNGYGSQASIAHTGAIIRNNRYYNNQQGFEIYGSNHLVYNNLAYNSGNGLICYGCGSNKIYNNTFYNNGGGIYLGGSGNSVRNNILYQSGSIDNGGNSQATISNNLTTNPSCVNASAGDFHLQAGSPAIDAGVTISEVTTDFDKRSRPQGAGFDIGAYEYAGSAPRPLSAPTNLRIAGR